MTEWPVYNPLVKDLASQSVNSAPITLHTALLGHLAWPILSVHLGLSVQEFEFTMEESTYIGANYSVVLDS